MHEKWIPQELRALPQWVLWRAEERGGKITKVPCRTNGTPARANDPETWTTFEQAKAALPGFAGLGFVFSEDDPYVGIDLDHCRDPEARTTEPWAIDLLQMCGDTPQATAQKLTYAEGSPSGTGIHIIGKGKVGTGRKCGQVEVYDRARFFTITGNHLAGHQLMALDIQPVVNLLVDYYFPQREVQPRRLGQGATVPDDVVLTKAFQAKNGERTWHLFKGGQLDYKSPSEADFALLGRLAFWTESEDQLDRLFRRSGRYRQKWDEQRGEGTYGERSIQKLIAETPKPQQTPALAWRQYQ